MSDQEDFAGSPLPDSPDSPAVHAEGAGADESFFGDPETVLRRRGGGRQGRPRATPRSGSFGAYIVSQSFVASASSSGQAAAEPREIRTVEGLARLTWTFESIPPEAQPGGAPSADVVGQPARGGPAWGQVDYVVEEAWQLLEPMIVLPHMNLRSVACCVDLERSLEGVGLRGTDSTADEIIDMSQVPVASVWCKPKADVMPMFHEACPYTLLSVPLRQHVSPSDFVFDNPPMAILHSWRRKVGPRPRNPRSSSTVVAPPRPFRCSIGYRLSGRGVLIAPNLMAWSRLPFVVVSSTPSSS